LAANAGAACQQTSVACGQRLAEIPGVVISPRERVSGCVFASRCPQATDVCRQAAPALAAKAPSHRVACHHAPGEAVAA
jgi:peptide/nickel transport system ATP-binding protein